MAELLLRVVDKVNPDFYQNCKCTKRGDVIVIRPNGWTWGTQELTDPNYRIVKLPNISEAFLSPFLAQEPETDPQHPSRTLQRRWYRFDLASGLLPQPFINYLNDAERKSAFFSSNFSEAQVAALRVQKAPVVDPIILGGSPAVIG